MTNLLFNNNYLHKKSSQFGQTVWRRTAATKQEFRM